MDTKKDTEILQFVHDRLVHVYGESENTDYLINLREIIEMVKIDEQKLEQYRDFTNQR